MPRDEAIVVEEIQPRASMRGATKLLREILDDLEQLAARRQPEFAPSAAGQAQPDPEARGPAATLGDLIDRLDERAFGILFFLLALPCSIPLVTVLPQIFSLPMLALAGQMAMGRKSPWLPESFRKRAFPVAALKKVLDRSERYVGWFEALAQPRLRAVTGHGGSRFIGALLIIPIASILFPMIGTNTVPGIGVCIVALGLIERDGFLVILGLLIGVLWVIAFAVVVTFFGIEAIQFAKDWLLARF
jgi:hypothetical protein